MVQKWLEGKLQVFEVKSFVRDWFFNEKFKKLYTLLSDFVHTNPKGLGLLIDTSTENILVKIAPLLPDSPEDQAAILVFPIVHNCILLMLLKEVYSDKIEQSLMDKILETIRHTSSHFKI